MSQAIDAALEILPLLAEFKDKGVEWSFIRESLPHLKDTIGNSGYYADLAGYIERFDKKQQRAYPGDNKKISEARITPKYLEDLFKGGTTLIKNTLLETAKEKSKETAKLEKIKRGINYLPTNRKDQYNRDLYTLAEVATMLNVSTSSIQNYYKQNKLNEFAESVDQNVAVRTANPRLFYHRNQIHKIALAMDTLQAESRSIAAHKSWDTRRSNANMPQITDIESDLNDIEQQLAEYEQQVSIPIPATLIPQDKVTLLKPGQFLIIGNKLFVNNVDLEIVPLKPGQSVTERQQFVVALA